MHDRRVLAVRGAAVALAVAATATQLLDFGVYDNRRLRLFDMMTHRSLFGITSLAVLAVSACTCALIAFVVREHRVRYSALCAIQLILLVLRIAQPSHVLLFALPASAVALALLWTAPMERRLIREGCVVLVVAFVVHGIGEKVVDELGYGTDTWAYQIKAVVKHSGELLGWALVAGGMLSALSDVLPRRRAAAPALSPRRPASR